jgi:hypothetical protein
VRAWINLKTQTPPDLKIGTNKYQAPITNDQNKFRILNLGNWNLFVICDLLFEILITTALELQYWHVLNK